MNREYFGHLGLPAGRQGRILNQEYIQNRTKYIGLSSPINRKNMIKSQKDHD